MISIETKINTRGSTNYGFNCNKLFYFEEASLIITFYDSFIAKFKWLRDQ